MNIFIGENNLKDYVFLKSIIEKWGIERQQEIYFYWYKQLYYQLPKCLKNCDLVFLELDMKHINGFEFAKILRKKDLSIPDFFSVFFQIISGLSINTASTSASPTTLIIGFVE